MAADFMFRGASCRGRDGYVMLLSGLCSRARINDTGACGGFRLGLGCQLIQFLKAYRVNTDSRKSQTNSSPKGITPWLKKKSLCSDTSQRKEGRPAFTYLV